MKRLAEMRGGYDKTDIALLAGAALLLTAATVGVLRTAPDSKTLFVDCDQNPSAGAIFDLNMQKFPSDIELRLDDGSETKKVFVKHGGHLVVDGTTVFSDDAGNILTTMSDGTQLIAGAPIPQKLDGYTAGDEALTLACEKATPASVARSQAEMTAITS
jgi:hypothetical protein